jgi:membrane associated rhomboid family serine protease
VLNLIPISDANPTRRFPIVTVGLIVANVIAFFQTPDLGQGVQAGPYFVEHAPIPCQLQDACRFDAIQFAPGVVERIPDRNLSSFLIAIVVSTFLHAGFLHIIGNMLFLWVFGNNVEDYLGRVKFLLFYLLGGIAAAFAHILTHLDDVIPSVGASGAVAAVMGAYLVLFPRARVNVLVPIFILWTIIQLSAWAVLGLWFLYQFLIGFQEAAGTTGVAWMAHVGGFVYGVVIIYLLGGRPHKFGWRPEWERYR